ncbi:E3 ubiquitin-protein ligase BRE1A-like [Anomalospiza imberbis]|uniref:E3 ubiquitin-protein ligase BRE1A-like n=1 Tax=Anomalospiza imberbis TaxID=187417 RepID=UPI00358F37A5
MSWPSRCWPSRRRWRRSCRWCRSWRRRSGGLQSALGAVEKELSLRSQALELHKRKEEEALLSEMDVTGQAFEDMQEQNLRLLQQLREKDDANFKLMSERIKANQIHKLLREEKDELAEQVLALKAQVEAQLQVVQKLEEKAQTLISANNELIIA